MKESRRRRQCSKNSFCALFVLHVLVLLALCDPPRCKALSSSGGTSRRTWMNEVITSSTTGIAILSVTSVSTIADPPSASAEVDVLPSEIRQYTALAPLGTPTTTGQKLTNLPLQALADRLANDLTNGSTGMGGYFISGDLSTELFRDDCIFTDPTNSVSSLSRYQNALGILFDRKSSYVNLINMTIDEPRNEIKARIQSGGVLQLPWKPRISTYESDIVYKIDNDGLVESQIQSWSISASQALQETFTPSFLKSPFSTIPKPQNEPIEVTKLFDILNGNDPESSQYSKNELFQISNLIEEIVDKRYDWDREDLPGKWALVFLQPGPDGGGIDRRIPFPEFRFNHNYQIFTKDSVTNVGELLGPMLEVRVGGGLEEMDDSNVSTPKRFQANIERGDLCFGTGDKSPCVPLPIRGEGLFDGVYLGKRLRIGQNLNGSGARVVQVKIS